MHFQLLSTVILTCREVSEQRFEGLAQIFPQLSLPLTTSSQLFCYWGQGFRRALMRDTGSGDGKDDTTDESQGKRSALTLE